MGAKIFKKASLSIQLKYPLRSFLLMSSPPGLHTRSASASPINLNNIKARTFVEVKTYQPVDKATKKEHLTAIIDVLRRAFDTDRSEGRETTIASKLVTRVIQKLMNHANSYYFKPEDNKFFGEITNKNAIQFFDGIMNENGLTYEVNGEFFSLKNGIERLCTHTNTLGFNKKLELFKTNYTDEAIELRDFIKSYGKR